MKEYLHLFELLSKAVLISGNHYVVKYEDGETGYNRYGNKGFEPNLTVADTGSSEVFTYDKRKITHVLDLSKLTTKERVYEAVDKYCSDLEINTEVVIESYFKDL